jgi:hypothetical protein
MKSIVSILWSHSFPSREQRDHRRPRQLTGADRQHQKGAGNGGARFRRRSRTFHALPIARGKSIFKSDWIRDMAEICCMVAQRGQQLTPGIGVEFLRRSYVRKRSLELRPAT